MSYVCYLRSLFISYCQGKFTLFTCFYMIKWPETCWKTSKPKKVAVVYFQHMFWLNCHGFSISRRWCTVKKCVRTNTVVLNGIRKVPHRDLKLNIQKVLMGNVGKYMLGSPNRILSCTFHLGCEATVAPAAIEKSNFYQLFQPGKELCHQGVICKAFSRLVLKNFQYCTFTLHSFLFPKCNLSKVNYDGHAKW